MKCIRRLNDGTVVRLKDWEAHTLVKQGLAVYVPKKDWKATGRHTLHT